LVVPDTPISFDRYLVPRGIQPGENALPEEETKETLPPLNEEAYGQLQEMGFPANRAEKALRVTGNGNADVAMQWLFDHMEDPDIDLPYTSSSTAPIDSENVQNLMGMGFEEHMAKKALQETVLSK
jgi:ubiquitin carboxyl-terminal hydrolase 5/13